MSTEHERDAVDLIPAGVIKPFARATVLAALTGATALISIPLPLSPVPLTLQVLFVFLAGLYLGPIWGAGSMLLYLAAGAAGAPVFAYGTAGFGVLVGDTGGFLWSYPVAAFLIGTIVHGRQGLGLTRSDGSTSDADAPGFLERCRVRNPADVRLPILVAALVSGTLVVYTMGAGYAMWLLALAPGEAIALYVAPFVVAELVKILAAITIVRSELIDPT